MSKFKICVCKDKYFRDYKEFNSLEDLVEWCQDEIKKNAPLKIGDKVRVIDTGKCYSNISKETYYNFYLNSPYDVGECLEIASEINHNCLGYLEGIKELPDDEFEVVALFKNTIDYVLLKPINKIKYHGYYIIAKDGVKKWL